MNCHWNMDSENDSGYAPSHDIKLESSQIFLESNSQTFIMADSPSHNDCDDEDDIGEEEEAAEIHHSIETIIEGLLGKSLDDAPVDRIYSWSSEYEKLFSLYYHKLIEAIRNLSNSLRRALHSIPHQNYITPTAAHAALKCLIIDIISDSQKLPYLQMVPDSDESLPNDVMSLMDMDIFSYECLVATAILNKVVDESQLRYLKNEATKDNTSISKTDQMDERTFSIDQLPLECVQIEEVEEITREYTDSDDDLSEQSSIEERSTLKLSKQRSESAVDFFCVENNNLRVPFPEFGLDLVHGLKTDSTSICYTNIVSSWKENWLFKKSKRLPLNSSMKDRLLSFYDEPTYMLIPCPSDDACIIELNDLASELSESHSIGSVEHSSDSDGNTFDDIESSPSICMPTPADFLNENKMFSVQLSEENSQPVTQIAVNVPNYCDQLDGVPQLFQPPIYKNISTLEEDDTTQVEEAYLESCKPIISRKNDTLLMNSNGMVKQENNCDIKVECPNSCYPAGDIFLIPTQPGTIAEREHKKWQDAIPLKNNPYSAENISRRCGNHHGGLFSVNSSSYEECHEKSPKFSQENGNSLETVMYCGLKSIDNSRYERDYYVHNENKCECNEYKIAPSFESFNCKTYIPAYDEALNSLEEKVYIRSGKVFTSENQVRRLERELKDLYMSPITSLPTSGESHSENIDPDQIFMNQISYATSENDRNVALPSVKVLASKFNCPTPETISESTSEKSEPMKIKKARPCIKVHSLTARSLTREFRDRAKQNVPKPMNRLACIPLQTSDDAASEQDSICSLPAVSQVDITHGYTSDESSGSSNSLPRSKKHRHISHSILKRASYWERRLEQGLLSDASVNEEFPGLEKSDL